MRSAAIAQWGGMSPRTLCALKRLIMATPLCSRRTTSPLSTRRRWRRAATRTRAGGGRRGLTQPRRSTRKVLVLFIKTKTLFCFVLLAWRSANLLGTTSLPASRRFSDRPSSCSDVRFRTLAVRCDVLCAPARHRVGVARVGFEQAYPEHRGNPRFKRLRVDAQPVANHLGQRSVAALVREKNQRVSSRYLLQDAPVGPGTRHRTPMMSSVTLRVVHGVHAALEAQFKSSPPRRPPEASGLSWNPRAAPRSGIRKSPYSSRGRMTLPRRPWRRSR